MRVVLLVAFLMGLSGPAVAGVFMTGNQLHRICSGTVDEEIFCGGYVAGIADAMTDITGQQHGELRVYRACFPRTGTTTQYRDIVKAWLAKNPNQRHYGGGGVVAKALSEAFPCK